MAGYSGTPLAKKLGIDAGTRLALVAAPKGFATTLALPRTVKAASTLAGDARYDVMVFFTKEQALLRAEWKRDGVPMEERFGRLVRAALADQVGILK